MLLGRMAICAQAGILLVLLTFTVTSAQETTTEHPDNACLARNGSCDDCIGDVSCYYCEKTKECRYYPYKHLVPTKECGSLGDIKWGQCVVNLEILIICCSVAGGIILIGLICCCCCCCTRKGKDKWARESAKWSEMRKERQMQADERKRERQQRYDDIRRKYGILKDGGSPYQKFDN